jgi:Zn-dependent alcohol dehydrogenase
MKVHAAVIEAIDTIKMQDLELDDPGPGEVLVRLVATGVCHTDLSMIRGNLPVPTPFVAGHEGAGVVEAIGPGVDHLQVGDHVVCSIVQKCGMCYMCVRGQNPCEKGGAVAFGGTMLDGTNRLHRGDEDVNHIFCQSSFADYTVVPGVSAIKVNPDAPLEKIASLGCGIGTGLGAAINRGKVSPGSTVMVMGAGGVGLAAMLGSRLAGALKVIAVDVAPSKLAKAKELAADETINSKETDLGDAIDTLTSGRGVDVAIDCVGLDGDPGTLEQCFRAVRPGGTAVAVGIMHATVSTNIDTFSLLTEKTLTGSWGGSLSPHRDIPYFVDQFMAGRLNIGALMDREGKLDEVETLINELEAGKFTRAVIRH